MLENRYKLRSRATCQSEPGSGLDIEHRNEDPVVETNKLVLSTNNIRRSARFQKKERITSCSEDNFVPEGNGIKCNNESSESSYGMKNSYLSSKLEAKYVIQVEQKTVNEGETADASSKSSTSGPSFEFHARSEAGIKLVIDLNSSPSDWSKSMEICLCQKSQKRKFQCLRQELEYLGNSSNLVRSSLINNTTSSYDVTEGHLQTVPSRYSYHNQNDQPACNDDSEKEKEISFFSASGVSSTECCPKIGEMETPSSVVHDTLQANGSYHVKLRKRGSRNSRTIEEQSLETNSTLTFSQVRAKEHTMKETPNDTSDQSENLSELVASSTHKRKRHQLKSDCTFDLRAGRILRSTKHFNGLVLRRSKRLETPNDTSDQSENLSELVASSTHKRKRHQLKSDCTFDPRAGRILRSTKHFNGLVLRRSKRLETPNDTSDQSENLSELVASSTHKRKRHQLKSDCTFDPRAGRILRSTKHFNGLVLRRSKRLRCVGVADKRTNLPRFSLVLRSWHYSTCCYY